MKRLRLISTLVILSICFSLHAEIVSGTCGANGGDNLTWTFDTESGLLKIEGSGMMMNHEKYSLLPWDSYKTQIRQVDLPEGLINIGMYAFNSCNGLMSVDIPNSVTTIGNCSFGYCNGLTDISIPGSVTTIEGYAFEGCTGLTSVIIPNSVTTIGDGAFNGCSSLIDNIIVNDMFVYLPRNYQGHYTLPSNIRKIIGHAFEGCTELVSITIPNSVITIGRCAFNNCQSLMSVDIPNSVTTIGTYAFRECQSLMSVDIPNSVITIGDYAFDNCRNLASVSIPSSVINMGYGIFYNCQYIKTLYINTSLNPGVVETGVACGELFIGDDVTTVYDYYNHFQLRKVVLGKKVSQIRAQAFSNANIQEFTITGEEPPYCYSNIFGTQDLSAATLYVPASKAEYYQTTEPWTEFGIVKTLEGETPVIPTACEKPVIAFENGKLLFTCGTNGAKYHCTITSPDMKNNELNEIGVVDLQACYDIYVYATADGFTQSETATAKLYWVKADGVLSGINQVERRGIVVSSDNGFVNVSGLNDGEHVTLYSTEGKLLGTQSAQGGACIFTTFEKVVIVKIGDSSFKVMVK